MPDIIIEDRLVYTQITFYGDTRNTDKAGDAKSKMKLSVVFEDVPNKMKGGEQREQGKNSFDLLK